MPYIHLSIGKKITPAQRDALAEKIGKAVTILPEKTFEKTMVHIDEDCVIYRGGKRAECLYMETRIFKDAPVEAETEYARKLYAVFNEVLGIPDTQVYMNILELNTWASKGGFSHS